MARVALRFASDEWLAAIAAALEGVTLDGADDASLVFEVPGRAWHLAVEAGRVVGLAPGSLDAPDCTLRWDAGTAVAIWSRRLRGNEALLATEVVAPVADGLYVGTPAPLDLGCRPELLAMEEIPGATFDVQYRFRRGPFGDVDYVVRFVDGRFGGEALERLSEPVVGVDVTYRAMACVRSGELSILDALTDGSVTGAVGPLAVLAGISESPEFEAAQTATGRHAHALATLGALDASPELGAVLAELAAVTTDA